MGGEDVIRIKDSKLEVTGEINATGDICTEQGDGVCLSTVREKVCDTTNENPCNLDVKEGKVYFLVGSKEMSDAKDVDDDDYITFVSFMKSTNPELDRIRFGGAMRRVWRFRNGKMQRSADEGATWNANFGGNWKIYELN